MRVYISGPMTGFLDYNYPMFHKVADEWRKLGHDVLCPAENFNGSTDLPWSFYMKEDLRLISHCDAIVVLPFWWESRGALIEVLTAITYGLPVFNQIGDEVTVNFTLIGKWLREWGLAHEYRNIGKDEVGQEYPDGGTNEEPAHDSGSQSSWSFERGGSDTWVEGEEPGSFARLGTVRLRQGTVTFSGIATGEKWESKPLRNPMPQ